MALLTGPNDEKNIYTNIKTGKRNVLSISMIKINNTYRPNNSLLHNNPYS